MLLCLWVSVLLRHTKIDNVDNVLGFGVWASNEKVVGLDVAVYQVLFVDRLNAGQHLFGDHDYGLDGESTATVVKEVFQTWAKEVND